MLRNLLSWQRQNRAAGSLLQAELKLAVAKGVVHARDGRPELPPLEQPRHREGGLLAGVRVVPLGGAHLVLRVRRVLQGVVLRGPGAILDLPDLLADRDHRIAETVQLGPVLGLRGLDHEGVRHRPRHRRRVEAVVLEPLGDVLLGDAALPPDVGEVHDELVGALVVGVGGAHREVGGQARLHVVGVEDGVPGRVGNALGAQHRAEHPRDDRDARLAPRRRRHRAEVSSRGGRHDAVVRQVRRQVLPDADRPEARAAAAVRDAERLVQVEVAHVGADHAGGSQAQLRVHVSAVHVHLAAVVVDSLAHLLDIVLEKGARRRVRHHEGRQPVLVRLAERLELREVHARRIVDPLDLHVAHGRRSRVRAVRGARDDAHVARALSDAGQVLPDHQEPGVLAGGAAGGLQRAGVEPGAADQVLFQGFQQLHVALRLARRRKRVHAANFRPTARRQGGHRVQFHRARAQGYHGPIQGQVLLLQRENIPHHLRLGPDAVEDLLLQEGRRAREGGRQLSGDGDVRRAGAAAGPGGLDRGHEGGDVLLQMRLVEAGRDPLVIQHPQVEPLLLQLLDERFGARRGHVEGHRVEKGVLACNRAAEFAHLLREQLRDGVDLLRDLLQAVRPVEDRVHRGHVRQQHLRGADVGRRLVHADVLLAGLQREPVGRLAEAVHGLADDPAGHAPHLLLAGRQIRGRRAAEPHGHAEALHRPDDHVGAELAGWLGRDEREGVRGDDEVRLVAVERVGQALVVVEHALGVRVLHQRAAEFVHAFEVGGPVVADDQLHAEVLRPDLHQVDRLRVHLLADEELGLGLRIHGARDHRHGLCPGGALVQERGVGHLHARELAHQRLEVHQRLEAALRDLRLVRRIRGVPPWILEQVPLHHAGDVRSVIAHADEVLGDHVLREDGLRHRQRLRLAQRRAVGQVQRDRSPDGGRDRL
mmetsp:Transcript_91931/g.281295  ORF Transcript_91931/g.281295 Transcript_91931/m.281295 type:complete len:932 (-) Transcript_91931:353-3148(-)